MQSRMKKWRNVNSKTHQYTQELKTFKRFLIYMPVLYWIEFLTVKPLNTAVLNRMGTQIY